MANENNVIVKVGADTGGTVLFRTTQTGGELQISLDNTQWFTVGGDAGTDYTFMAPITESAGGGRVSLNIIPSDNISAGEVYQAVVVGSITKKIGFNLLPDIVYNVRDLLGWDNRVRVDKLPLDSSDKLPKELIPSGIDITWLDFTV